MKPPSDVLRGIRNIDKYNRSDDYYEKLADTYRAMTAEGIDAAARKTLSNDGLLFIVVGDASVVKPQLESIGLPIEMAGETAIPSAADKK